VTPPAIEMVGVSRRHAGPLPLRLRHFVVAAGDRRVIAGLDRGAAEMFVLLVTGAALPDEGTVRIDGRDTREISTDTAWLATLDRFGIVTERAVLIDKLPIQANLALPLTLSIDPMTDLVRAQVERLADEVELARARLSAPAASLTASERLRIHLARALALDPGVLLLEHPTATLGEASERAAFGETLRAVAERRGIGWVALSDDVEFAQRSGGERHRLVAETGELGGESLWRRLSAGLRRRS
jgi:ABC-type lipoprotein export system ATPase subunit